MLDGVHTVTSGRAQLARLLPPAFAGVRGRHSRECVFATPAGTRANDAAILLDITTER